MMRHIYATKSNGVLATIRNSRRITRHRFTRILRNRARIRNTTSDRQPITVNRVNSGSIQRQPDGLLGAIIHSHAQDVKDVNTVFNRHHQRGTCRHSNSRHR